MNSLNLNIRTRGRRVLVDLPPMFDIDNALDIQNFIERLIDAKCQSITLNMKHTLFIDSSATSCLKLLFKKAIRSNTQLAIKNPDANITHILSLSQVTQILNIID